jgi:hypothetical protein
VSWSHGKAKKETWFAVLFCLLGTALFFRGPLFFPKFYHIPYDLEEYHQPLSELIAASLRESGQLPLWNPYHYMGEPFFANVQAAMFYPFTLLTVLLGNALDGRVTLRLLELQLVAHVALAGIGMYVLLRMLNTTFFAALAGAIVFHLGAFFASQTQHLGAISEAAWLPWLLAALCRLVRRRDLPSTALAGLAFGLMILPGFPAAFIPAMIFAPLICVFWLWQRHPRLEWRAHAGPVLLLAASFLLGLLLSAVSWLPGYQVGKQSAATLRPATQSLGGLSIESATSLFWPNLLNQLRGMPWLPQNRTFLHIYQGVPALLLVFGGLGWLVRSSHARPVLVAAIISALWMFGTTFFMAHVFYALLPGFARHALYPDSVLAYFSLFFAGLAAFALDGWERGERHMLFPSRLCLRAGFLTLVIALLATFASGLAPADSPLTIRASAAGSTLLLVALFLGLCGFIARFHPGPDPAVRRRISAGLCVIILLDLVAVGSQTQLNTEEGEGDVPKPAVAFLQARLGSKPLYRIDTTDTSYVWRIKPMQWQLPSANGMNPLLLRDAVTYRATFSHLMDRSFILDSPESPLLDLAGIRYVVTERDRIAGANLVYQGEVNIFENPRALPRFFLAGAAIGVDGISEAIHKINIRQVDPTREVLVPMADIPGFAGIESAANTSALGKVELLSYAANEIRVRVTAVRPAAFVATEIYTRDWRAMLDGMTCSLVRADGVFRAIAVPAGMHEIRMFIYPRALYQGAALSLCGILLVIFCLLAPLASRYRRRGGN